MAPFLFDFTFDKQNVEFIRDSAEQAYTPAPNRSRNGAFCPYPIPTVDEINKLINDNSHRVNKSQIISDTFECGAIAVSNLVDLPQAKKNAICRSYETTKSPNRNLLRPSFRASMLCFLPSYMRTDGLTIISVSSLCATIREARTQGNILPLTTSRNSALK